MIRILQIINTIYCIEFYYFEINNIFDSQFFYHSFVLKLVIFSKLSIAVFIRNQNKATFVTIYQDRILFFSIKSSQASSTLR